MNGKTLLALSLALNLGLAAMIAWMARSQAQRVEKTNGVAAEPATTGQSETAPQTKPVIAEASPAPVAGTAAQSFDWRAVESEDYKKYIANLRSIGCPEETIRDIITADVNKLYESKRKEIVGPAKKFEFWKAGAIMGAAVDPERTEKERALNKEKRALLIELLGSAPDEKPELLAGASSQIEAMFDFLPADKRSKVFELMQDMQLKMQKAAEKGGFDPEDIGKIMKESEAALAGVLTPEELLEYNLRFSMTANMMRMQMAGFEPSEKEFLDIFKMRKAYDDEYGVAGMGGGNLNDNEKQKQKLAQEALNKQIKEMLGESRYEDYTRAQDYNFQALDRIAKREGLGKDAAIKAYEMKKIAEDQARTIRQDKSLAKEQRNQALSVIRQETDDGLKKALGQKGYDSYLKQAHWLNSISPAPKN